MRLFEAFSVVSAEKILNSFFRKLNNKINSDNVLKSSNPVLLEATDVRFEIDNLRKVYGSNNEIIGSLFDIYLFNSKGEEMFKNNKIEDVLFLTPDKDGYFNFLGNRYYSPFVIFDKFESSEEYLDDELEIVEDSSLEKNKSLDLSKCIVLQGYYVAFASTLLAMIYSKVNHKNFELKNEYLNQLAGKLGVAYFRYFVQGETVVDIAGENKEIKKWVAQKIPIFFLPDAINQIELSSNPRKVVYPNDNVSMDVRFPHESHFGIVDLLETPESDKIGLTLTLVESNDLEYDFDNLRIVNKKVDYSKLPNLSKDSTDFLSISTKQIPFILHSDGARMLMGSKNLKQTIKVVGGEEPIIRTGFERENVGVNALVAYGLFKGFNFEDGIVVSRSFAEKMKVVVRESEKFTVPVCNAKSPYVNGDKWIYEASKNEKVTVKWSAKKNESVAYGRPLFEVSKGKSKLVYNYEGRYSAKIVHIPDKPPFPYLPFGSKEREKEYFVDFYIEYEVEKPLELGDKLMGRHGNKGTVALILPDEEMPKALINGELKTIDVILSPLGVVSRMNLGQLYETHISIAKEFGNFNISDVISPLENAYQYKDELLKALKSIGSDDYGRFKVLYGNNEWWLTVGYQYLVRLDHCVRDKIHVVSIADESEITGQPKKGRSRNGGQRFGELEFWSLYSYGNKKLAKLFAAKNLSVDSAKRKKLDIYPDDRLNDIFSYALKLKFGRPGYMVSKLELVEDSEEYDKYIKDYVEMALYRSNEDYYRYLSAKIKIEKQGLNDLYERFANEIETVFKETSNQEDITLEQLKVYAEKVADILEKYPEIADILEPSWRKKLQKGGEKAKDSKLYDGIAITKELNEIFNMKTEQKVEKHLKILRLILRNLLELRKDNSKLFKKAYSDTAEFLMKKEGYIRNVVIARRLHYSGRTVISPMPLARLDEYNEELDIDTVVIPVDFGIEWYRKVLKENFNISNDKIISALRGDENDRKELARLLNKYVKQEDVYVLLNRQPSIHRHSIQGFKPIFWHNYTIGLPINVCEGFNADFDGDTMAVYLPFEQTEEIKEEIRKMLPSRNPFKLGNGELIYSVDQDMVYGYYILTGKDKKALKSEIAKKIRELALKNDYDGISKYIKDTILLNYLNKATEVNLTLSVFEIVENKESMQKIRESKCRGNEKQYNQLNISIETEGGYKIPKGFVHGVDVKDYFNVEHGIVKRARRTLMDKKLRVAEAGYFTRKLVELLGTIQTSSNTEEFIEHEIDLSKKLVSDKKFGEIFKKERFVNRWIKLGDKTVFVESVDDIPEDKFIVLSPKICDIGSNRYVVSAKYCGRDLSKLEELKEGEYIGLTAGHVIGERGTQLSMETFHTGGKGFSMGRTSSSIFRHAFESQSYQEFLMNIEDEFYNDMGDSLLGKLDSSSIYFEMLYNFAQYLKSQGIKSPQQYYTNLELRGPLTCMSFEKGLDILENIELNKEYNETHPRVEYAFYWRWM